MRACGHQSGIHVVNLTRGCPFYDKSTPNAKKVSELSGTCHRDLQPATARNQWKSTKNVYLQARKLASSLTKLHEQHQADTKSMYVTARSNCREPPRQELKTREKWPSSSFEKFSFRSAWSKVYHVVLLGLGSLADRYSSFCGEYTPLRRVKILSFSERKNLGISLKLLNPPWQRWACVCLVPGSKWWVPAPA